VQQLVLLNLEVYELGPGQHRQLCLQDFVLRIDLHEPWITWKKVEHHSDVSNWCPAQVRFNSNKACPRGYLERLKVLDEREHKVRVQVLGDICEIIVLLHRAFDLLPAVFYLVECTHPTFLDPTATALTSRVAIALCELMLSSLSQRVGGGSARYLCAGTKLENSRLVRTNSTIRARPRPSHTNRNWSHWIPGGNWSQLEDCAPEWKES